MEKIVGCDDTIAAIATAQGASGIGIVRISGKDALKIADNIFLSKDGRKPSSFKTYTVHYGWIVSSYKLQDSRCCVGVPSHKLKTKSLKREACSLKHDIIDEVILTVMRAPKSYTKEDIVEISCHGGIVALRKTLESVLARGARLAEPGEFTKRAFLNGRIDLSQAEAVLDVVQAKTEASLCASSQQLKGALSDEINSIRGQMFSALTYIEASIDFPEEDDVDRRDNKSLIAQIEFVQRQIKRLLDSACMSKLIREGISVVICGRPNVGKSSLLNALLKEERVIVTSVPGTTRDVIEETLDIKGIPVKIVDTAGMVEPRDLVEKEAVSRAHRYFDTSDIVLFVLDISQKLSRQDKALMAKLNGRPTVAVLNKIDLPRKLDKRRLRRYFKTSVEISALKQKGIKDLEEAIADTILCGKVIENEGAMIGNLRQKDSLGRALDFIDEVLSLLKASVSFEFVAETIKNAIGCLDEITGKKITEDLLEKIFSEFCIGK